jgi:unsaturated chondroitin disaccharide hydrolase
MNNQNDSHKLLLNKEALLKLAGNVTNSFVQNQLNFITNKVKLLAERVGDNFPAPCCKQGGYPISSNKDWTTGFWSALLWLCYQYTGDSFFYTKAKQTSASFIERLNQNIELNHHDIGFLYSLSLVADYQITADSSLIPHIIKAANILTARYHSKAGFIQAWGAMDSEKEYRLIIDSLLNLPLLYQAFNLSGDQNYKTIAHSHYQNVINTVIRNNFSTYHTYYFDKNSHKPSYGATAQGYTNDSCWSRGQAWAIAGLAYQCYHHSSPYPHYDKIVDYFLTHLKDNLVPSFDFNYNDTDDTLIDTSASAISACGLLVANNYALYPQANNLAKGMV